MLIFVDNNSLSCLNNYLVEIVGQNRILMRDSYDLEAFSFPVLSCLSSN